VSEKLLSNNSQSDDLQLDEFFQTYRAACPDVEAGRNFMPNLWQRIEARQTFWFVFQRFAKTATAACGALCLLMLALNLYSPHQASTGSYMDALMADHTAEKTYYTEAIRSAPDSNDVPDGFAASPEE
jgi:hypothetical protein